MDKIVKIEKAKMVFESSCSHHSGDIMMKTFIIEGVTQKGYHPTMMVVISWYEGEYHAENHITPEATVEQIFVENCSAKHSTAQWDVIDRDDEIYEIMEGFIPSITSMS